MSERTAVTVAVCTRDRGRGIADTLASILGSATELEYELLVVDQSTGAETAEVVRELAGPRTRLVRTSTRGIGPSRDLAVREAAGRYVLFTDDDCRVPADWIDVMHDAVDRDPTIGMAFCNVVAGPHDPETGFVPTYVRRGEVVARTTRAKNRARGIGAGMAVRRAAALEVGGFDRALGTTFPRVGNEEGDLALRMILNGWAVLETDRVAVVHDGFRTWDQGRDLTARNFTGIGLVYAKPVRAGRWSALSVVLYEGVWASLVRPLLDGLRGRRPRLRGCWYFWRGFVSSFGHPIDRTTLCYEPDPER
jgi:GT2 family glycosyltransferase